MFRLREVCSVHLHTILSSRGKISSLVLWWVLRIQKFYVPPSGIPELLKVSVCEARNMAEYNFPCIACFQIVCWSNLCLPGSLDFISSNSLPTWVTFVVHVHPNHHQQRVRRWPVIWLRVVQPDMTSMANVSTSYGPKGECFNLIWPQGWMFQLNMTSSDCAMSTTWLAHLTILPAVHGLVYLLYMKYCYSRYAHLRNVGGIPSFLFVFCYVCLL